MDSALIEGFKRGKDGALCRFPDPEEGRGLPVTLPGFEQGFAQLQ